MFHYVDTVGHKYTHTGDFRNKRYEMQHCTMGGGRVVFKDFLKNLNLSHILFKNVNFCRQLLLR